MQNRIFGTISVVIAIGVLSVANAAEIEFTNGQKLESADSIGYYYKWTQDGTLTIPTGGKKVDILLVGGGGAGGFCRGGGGGGGGMIFVEGVTLPEGTYTITVGAGGVADAWTSSSKPTSNSDCYKQVKSTEATCGGNTSISNSSTAVYVAIGGGGGGSFVYQGSADANTGLSGGSGGGSAGTTSSAASGIEGQGYAGGSAYSNDNVSGGGGGAGSVGGTPTSTDASGNGGVGRECFITGESVYYAGGGGAGSFKTTAGTGGNGGGGNGATGSGRATAGADGFGGGGGGSSGGDNKWENCIGAAGGSGVVILREAAATRPAFTPVVASVDVDSLTLSATLTEIGTSPDGSEEGTCCIIKVAYGYDPSNLVYTTVKSDWTLANPDWSYTISNLTHYSVCYWQVRVENDVGNAPNADSTGSVLVGGSGWSMPGLITLADKTVSYRHTENYDYGGDPFSAIDGDITRRVDRKVNGSDEVTMSYDVGEPKHMGLFSMVFPSDPGNNYIVDRMGNLAVYGSNDRTNWTCVTSQEQVQNDLYGHAGEWIDYPILENGSYRYYEIRGLKYGNCGELKFISEEMGLNVNPPTVWASNTVFAADDPDGVSLSGTLTGSPSLETEIYGYWAKSDYDYNESAWSANGTKFTIAGTFKTNDTFNVKVPIAGKGRVYIRMFAKAGEQKTSSYCTWPVNLRSEAVTVPMYVSDSTNLKLQKWYDGNIGNYCDKGVNNYYVIFDLSVIPEGKVFAGVRFWPRSGGSSYAEWFRHREMKVSVSYDQDDITPSGDTLVEGREVYQIGDDSVVTDWQMIPDFISGQVVPLARVEEVPVTFAKNLGRPRYLKIEEISLGNLNEVEIRMNKSGSVGMLIYVR